MINLRTDIINYLIERYSYKTYLEIGVYDVNINFKKVIAPNKTGVDPNEAIDIEFKMTSDKFFQQNTRTFDIIFIDGDHHSGQVYKDIINSLSVLNEGGTIVMHDCNPSSEAMQSVPPIQTGEWTGDVWRAFVRFRSETTDYLMFVINTDFGVGVIRKANKAGIPLVIKEPLTYSNLTEKRTEWLNLIEVDDINRILNYYDKV
jgi:hypothetical protein